MFKVLLLAGLVLVANCEYNLYFNDTTYLDSFREGDFYFQAYYHPLFNQTIGFLKNLSDSEALNQPCRKSLKRWAHGIEAGEAWAIKFLESTGRTITGKLTGRNVNFGSFEYCTGFKSDQAKVNFDGKYCMVSVQTRESQIIKRLENYQSYYRRLSDSGRRLLEFNIGNAHGVCLPSSCEVEQVAKATNRVFKTFGLSVFTTEDSKCYTRSRPEPLTKLQIFSFAIIGTFMLLCFLAFFIKTEFLSNFSIPDNFRVIYNTDFKDKESEERANLHGGKAAMICLSIVTHSFIFYGAYFAHPYGTIKEQEVLPHLRIWLERYLPFASMMFLFGGFFASYSWHDVIKKQTIEFNFVNFVVIRYVKIAISSVPVILFFFILPQLSHGPYYAALTNHLADNCRRNGYKIFTLTTNVGDSFLDMCTVGNWYLSADFQIYLVSFFVIYYLAVKPRLGFALAFIQCAFFSTVSILYGRYFGIPAYFNALNLQIYAVDIGQDTYFPFFLHYNVYTVGMITGYLVKNKIKPKAMDYKLFRIVVWVSLVTATYLVFWYPHEVEHGRLRSNLLIETVYRLVDKVIFATTLAWTIYSTSLGYSRPLLWLLSQKFWIPWSRLAFTLSLCQFVFIGYSFATARAIFTFNFDGIIREIFVNLLFTFLLGNFIFLFIEGPLVSLLKSYLGLKRRSDEITIRKEK